MSSKIIDDFEKMRTVRLVPYQDCWESAFQEEALKIAAILGDNGEVVHHIGSTAIPGIYAKPIIDILPVVKDITLVDALNPLFENIGYVCMGEYGIPGRRFYWKKMNGERTHNIHLFEKRNPKIARHVGFRDYLRTHSNVAEAYSWIKRGLSDQFSDDIESYVNGKESFVRKIEYEAEIVRVDQLDAKDDIVLVPYDPNWDKLGKAEIWTIQNFIKLPFCGIEHLGSTSVEGLTAKPVIDIFIALKNIEEAALWIKPLEDLGYVYWSDNPDKSHHRYFKGMPPFGVKRTHHVHIMEMGDEFQKRVNFRDIIRQNETIRKEYELLKKQLATEFLEDREAYTDLKGDFIVSILSQNKPGFFRMKKELVNKSEIQLVGLSVRTNNKNEMSDNAKIGHLVALYFSQNSASRIKNRKNPGVTLSVYTEYDTNEHGDYTYFIGEEVESFDDTPIGFKALTIPSAQYQKFTTTLGKMPEVVIQAWQRIWQMTTDDLGGKRAYKADFEVYDERALDPLNTVIDIYIGIEN